MLPCRYRPCDSGGVGIKAFKGVFIDVLRAGFRELDFVAYVVLRFVFLRHVASCIMWHSGYRY